MLKHLSVFIENKPGKLNRIIAILAQEKINLRAFTISGHDSFGVLKILVDDPGRAAKVLSAKGLAVAEKEIVAALVDDTPGAFNKLLASLSADGVNVLDSYGFLLEAGKKAVIVLECDDLVKAESCIREQGIGTLSDLVSFK